MIGRRSTIGLSLFCALALCAFVAQSASAAVAVNTTAFTCVKVEPNKGDFKDAHCSEKVEPNKGEFAHKAISSNEPTKVTITNQKTKGATTESTPAIFKGELAGVKLEGSCQTVSGEGTFVNEEPKAKVHTGDGSGTAKGTSCTVSKPTNCTLKEPLEIPGIGDPVEGLGAGKNEMGGELKPAEGEIFTTVTLEGEKCALKGKPLEVSGTAIVTGAPSPTEKHTGSTAILTNAMTKETLKLGGKSAELSATVTVQVAGGNPLAGTTVT